IPSVSDRRTLSSSKITDTDVLQYREDRGSKATITPPHPQPAHGWPVMSNLILDLEDKPRGRKG
ncbi:hypothetical protein LEMLEM_LOCUS8332, partial [Lemmus lemmus]